MTESIKKVKIGPFEYLVNYVDKLQTKDGNAVLYGEISERNSTIQLNTDMSPQFERVVLWHEIIHGLLDSGGFGNHDERMIDVLAHGLVQVLQDNPLLQKSVEQTTNYPEYKFKDKEKYSL